MNQARLTLDRPVAPGLWRTLDRLRGPRLSSETHEAVAAVLRGLLYGADDPQIRQRLRLLRDHPAWGRFLASLPRGPLRRRSLHRLFLAAHKEGPVDEGAAILGARFDLELSGGSEPWCWPSLLSLWRTLDVLPESAVARNPDLLRLCRADVGEGFGVYHDHHTRSPLGPRSAEISAFRLDRVSAEYRVPLLHFSATVRHEVGHAVAVRLGLYGTLYERVPQSPWIFQGDRSAFLHRLLGEGADPAARRLCELYLGQPAGRTRSLRRALHLLHQEEVRDGRRLSSRSLLRLPALRCLLHNSRHAVPCYHAHAANADGQVLYYDSLYHRGFAYDEDLYRSTHISDYQFRAPNEWFAELYAVYYADCDRGRPPGASLRRLSRPLRVIAEWFDARLDARR